MAIGQELRVYRLLICLLGTALCSHAWITANAQEESTLRQWEDPTGSFSVEARFIELRGANAALKKADDTTLLVPLSRLSMTDVKYIRNRISPKGEVPKLEGIWGGKWDDVWNVYLDIQPGDETDYRVEYIWRENRKRPLRKMSQSGVVTDGVIRSGSLLFKAKGNRLLLYGSFTRPRAAILVKLDVTRDQLETLKIENHGWQSGSPPAEDAKAEITGEQ